MSDSPLVKTGSTLTLIDSQPDIPIFRQDCGQYVMYYAPGCLCVTGPDDAAAFEATIARSETPTSRNSPMNWGETLWQHATYAANYGQNKQTRPFEPECLTLYINNSCTLACSYCYARSFHQPGERLELPVIAAAARLVATNCQRKGLPLRVVFHGGGEPTLDWGFLETVVTQLDELAQNYNLPRFFYIATNGVLTAQKATWLAQHFDLIGLSCDGPADIQDRQRPGRTGAATSPIVERTADVFHQQGQQFHVRATITPATVHRQSEIADYLCQRIAPDEIHFEPAYSATGIASDMLFDVSLVSAFVAHFLEAKQIAHAYGVPLSHSGSRLNTLHGPYCNVFREVLNLVPGGAATGCFKITTSAQAGESETLIGDHDPVSGTFVIDQSRVNMMRDRLSATPAVCETCFNRYHCVRDCPDRCPMDSIDSFIGDNFRCHLQKAFTYAVLRERADALWQQHTTTHGGQGESVIGTTAF